MADSRGRRVAVGVLAGVGALTILALLAAGAWYWKDKASVPERLVLEVDFERA